MRLHGNATKIEKMAITPQLLMLDGKKFFLTNCSIFQVKSRKQFSTNFIEFSMIYLIA